MCRTSHAGLQGVPDHTRLFANPVSCSYNRYQSCLGNRIDNTKKDFWYSFSPWKLLLVNEAIQNLSHVEYYLYNTNTKIPLYQDQLNNHPFCKQHYYIYHFYKVLLEILKYTPLFLREIKYIFFVFQPCVMLNIINLINLPILPIHRKVYLLVYIHWRCSRGGALGVFILNLPLIPDLLGVIRVLLITTYILPDSNVGPKYIYHKYSKHWLSTVAHTMDCVCSKILNRGLNHGLLFSLIKFFWVKKHSKLTWKFRIKI